MADQSPVMATQDDWDAAEQAAIAALPGLGLNTPEAIRTTKDKFTVWRQQNQHTREQVKAITELFLNKKKYADLTATAITQLGQTAGQTHIQSQQKAQDGATDLLKLAKSTDIEIQSIPAKFMAGFAGPIKLLGMLCCKFDGTRGFGEACINFANEITPAKIETADAQAAMADRQSKVTIDANKPSLSALGVLNAALLMTDPDNIGMGAAGGAKVQKQISEVSGANAAVAPATVPAPARPEAAAAPAGAASSANIAQLTQDLMARAKAAKIDLPERTALIAAGAVKKADVDQSGKIDKASEAAAFVNNKAVASLDADQRALLYKHIGLSPEGKIVAPVPGAPAPVLN